MDIEDAKVNSTINFVLKSSNFILQDYTYVGMILLLRQTVRLPLD